MEKFRVVGTSVKKKDAYGKVTGRAIYAEDMRIPGMLQAKVLRSPFPHAYIEKIDTSKAEIIPGVKCVLTAKDIKGSNRYGLVLDDQQVLAEKKVRFIGDAIAAVAAETEEQALEAVQSIIVSYRQLPVISTMEEALAEGAEPIFEEGNLLQHTKVRKGDVEKGFALSDVIVENTYITQAVEHAYIERECSVATSNLSGYLTIWTPTQSVNRDRRQISKALGLKFSQVRVIQTTTGGAFGGKDDITSEMYSALLASYTGRPVRYSMTREESFYSTTKRHPFKIVCKTGANKEGKLMALEGKIYGDTGGFASLGPFVVKRGGLHLSGPYHIPNIKVDTYTVYTNNVPSGAFRGFGVPQSAFAHESQMDMLAEKLNMSPVDIRLLNCLRPGLSNATGQVFQHGIGIGKTLEIAKEYYLKLKQEGGLQK